MAQARVKVLNEAGSIWGVDGGWRLYFQYCRYEYGDGREQNGYRFIWRRPNGNLQGARGQARIPSTGEAMRLMATAIDEGWGNHICDKTEVEESDE